MRLDTRKMWVSTAIVGCPKTTFSTTLAVFSAYAGEFDEVFAGARHFAVEVVDEDFGHGDDVFGLVVVEADGFDVGF